VLDARQGGLLVLEFLVDGADVGGELDVDATNDKETRFRLTLPPANDRTGGA